MDLTLPFDLAFAVAVPEVICRRCRLVVPLELRDDEPGPLALVEAACPVCGAHGPSAVLLLTQGSA